MGSRRQIYPKIFLYVGYLIGLFFLSACSGETLQAGAITIQVSVDGQVVPVQTMPGSSILDALNNAGIQLNSLDRTEPPSNTILTSSISVKVIRIEEKFEMEETTIPFDRQTIRNESLPQGQTLLIQTGINGKKQITYRTMIENGSEISKTIFKDEVIVEARPEIIMIGIQNPFSTIPIVGRIAYLTAGNAWVLEETTGNRRPGGN